MRAYALVGLCFGAAFCLGSLVVASVDAVEERDGTLVLDVEGGWEAPAPHARCAWIEDEARARDAGKTQDELAAQYAVVAEDANSFYRGTAHLFWYDFVVGGWGEYDLEEIGLAEPELADGSPIGRTATWTSVWSSNLQPDFNVRICDIFDASSSAVLRELDESNRFVQKSAESTSI